MSGNAISPFAQDSFSQDAFGQETFGHDSFGQQALPVQERWHRTDWRADAACSDAAKTSLFFPVGVTGSAEIQIRQAKAVCVECPVKAECLDFAITSNQEYGVWGGTSEEERRVLRRSWRAEQRALRAQAARKAS